MHNNNNIAITIMYYLDFKMLKETEILNAQKKKN